MRSEQVTKGLIIQILKNSEDRYGMTYLASLLYRPACPHAEKKCFKQGWEEFPVASPLATVVSRARTEAEGEIFFSCSAILLGLLQ